MESAVNNFLAKNATFFKMNNMSHFARELEAVMADKRIRSGKDLADMCGVPQSTISRIRSGAQQISLDDLTKIAVGLGSAPMIHARLLRARLLEELHPPGGHLVRIDLPSYHAAEDVAAEAAVVYDKLPPKLETALRAIETRAATDPQLRRIVLNLGSLCVKGHIT
jgi:transcriptional regulator with XRE-family HTH domain